jgi:hypothetical protein
MDRLALFATCVLCVSTSAFAADLGPYPQRDAYAPPPPRVVERERIIEHHHYYERAPVYHERRVYVEPRAYYAPRIYADDYYPRRTVYAYAGWRPRYFFPRERYWHHHHRRGW